MVVQTKAPFLFAAAILTSVTLGTGAVFFTPETHSASASTPERWLPPLERGLRIAKPYDIQGSHYEAGHRGIDLIVTGGEAIRSPTDGTVSFVGTVVDRPVISVRIDSSTVLSIEPAQSNLAVGDPVTRGAPLGIASSGGHCDTSCIHLGVRVDGSYVNPVRYFRSKPELRPWN